MNYDLKLIDKIKTEYITSSISYSKLSKKYGIPVRLLGHYGKKDKWVEQRQRYRDKICAKSIAKMETKAVNNMTRINSITDKLLSKLEKAIDQLEFAIVEDSTKTRTTSLNEDEVPVEVETTTKKLRTQKIMVDRSGIKQIASALKDIKEIQMIKSKLDEEEQQARIDRLRKDIESDQADTSIHVTFDDEMNEYTK